MRGLMGPSTGTTSSTDPSTPPTIRDIIFPNANTLKLYFLQPDTVNITTHIKYTDNGGNDRRCLHFPPDSSSITLANFQLGSSLSYQSSYVPVTGSIDTFSVVIADTLSNLALPNLTMR